MVELDFDIRPICPAIGAEVVGLDLSKLLSSDQFEKIWHSFLEYHLLVFRDQNLNPEEQIAFSKQIGELESFPEADKTKEAMEVYHVANVSPKGQLLGSQHS